MITYEYPLSERIRTLLRLEDLFERTLHFVAGAGPEEHHVALVTLFEILEVASRADLKFDLVQELERQRQILLSFRNNPEISEDALSGALYEIEQASAALLAMQGKIGHYLRENEWLMSIKSRAAIPGLAAREFKKWDKAGGVRMAGLTRRREAERRMFIHGVYEGND